MSKKNNLLVAASGTGGHIFPALAVSKEVEDEWNIHWLGIQQRLDANLIPQKYNLKTLNLKTPRKNIFLFYQYIKILMSTFQIIRILKEKKLTWFLRLEVIYLPLLLLLQNYSGYLSLFMNQI